MRLSIAILLTLCGLLLAQASPAVHAQDVIDMRQAAKNAGWREDDRKVLHTLRWLITPVTYPFPLEATFGQDPPAPSPRITEADVRQVVREYLKHPEGPPFKMRTLREFIFYLQDF